MRRSIAIALAFVLLSCLACKPRTRVAGFGDSLTAGPDWLDLLPAQYVTQNFGVGGETSWDGVDRLLTELPTLEADVVTIFWGTNDVTRGSWQLASTLGPLTTAVDAVLAAGMKAVLVVPPPIFGNYGSSVAEINARLAVLQTALYELGASRGVPVAPVNLAFWLQPEIPDDYSLLYWDWVHPNWLGRAIEAEVIRFSIDLALVP